ncbi:MAG TPA: DUF6683 family protein [Aliidongia sp.]|nr:DUF6683 family protein [Aliidongia sp.]
MSNQRPVLAAFLLGGLILLPAAVRADIQPSFDYMPQLAQGIMLQETLRRNLMNMQHGPDRKRAPQQGAAAPAMTSYHASPEVSARVLKQYASFAAGLTKQPSDLVLARLQQDNVLGEWDKGWNPDGLHEGDLLDAITSYWITNWVIANGYGDTTKAQALGALEQMRTMLADNAALAKLDEAGRQEVAEIYMLNGVMQAVAYIQAHKSGDQTQLAQLGAAAEKRFRNEAHIDLRGFVLTDQGFIKKP